MGRFPEHHYDEMRCEGVEVRYSSSLFPIIEEAKYDGIRNTLLSLGRPRNEWFES
jgi:hypothetical protein